jgi:hypothetical protein
MITASRQQLAVYSKQRAVHIRQREVELFSGTFAVLTTQAAFLATISFINLFMQPDTIDLSIANSCIAYYSSCLHLKDDNGKCCICHNASAPCFARTGHGGAPHASRLLTPAAPAADCEGAGGICEEIHKPPNHFMELLFFACSTMCACLSLFAVATATYAMIYGPSLAIHGPEGSMTRSINAMHATRTVVLRAFFGALFFGLLSIPFLGFMKLDKPTATLMTIVIGITMAAVATKTKQVRRKFSFDTAHRSTFLVGNNFDPETRRAVASAAEQPPTAAQRARPIAPWNDL